MREGKRKRRSGGEKIGQEKQTGEKEMVERGVK